MENQDKENRERESKLTEDTLNLAEKDIVKEIFYHSSIPKHHGPQLSLNRTLAYFSALLFKLSQKAEESTQKTINLTDEIKKLTKKLICLTWIIIFLTVILLLTEFFEFPKKTIFCPQKETQANQHTQQKQTDESMQPSVNMKNNLTIPNTSKNEIKRK